MNGSHHFEDVVWVYQMLGRAMIGDEVVPRPVFSGRAVDRALAGGALLGADVCALFAGVARRVASSEHEISSDCLSIVIETCPQPDLEGELTDRWSGIVAVQ
jgi:hypothetical protein